MKESALQKQIVNYVRVAMPECLLWHCPNAQIMQGVIRWLSRSLFGITRGDRYADNLIGRFVNFLKSIGLCPGIPDLFLAWRQGNLICIELKTETGKTSEDQESIHKTLTDLGFTVFIVRTFEQFLEIVREMNIPCRDAMLNGRKS